MSTKPFPALCTGCKHSEPDPNAEWSLRCLHPKVNAKDAWALSATKLGRGSDCRSEREKSWPSQCGQRGALWEPK